MWGNDAAFYRITLTICFELFEYTPKSTNSRHCSENCSREIPLYMQTRSQFWLQIAQVPVGLYMQEHVITNNFSRESPQSRLSQFYVWRRSLLAAGKLTGD